MLLSTYADFRLFAFLLKSFSVVKVSKRTILFQSIGIKEWIRRNLRYTADQKALLVWDSFHGHLMEAIKEPLPGVLGNTGTVAFIFREQGIFSNYFQGTGELLTRLLGSREHQFTFNNGQ